MVIFCTITLKTEIFKKSKPSQFLRKHYDQSLIQSRITVTQLIHKNNENEKDLVWRAA
jgi:hypothetical protein